MKAEKAPAAGKGGTRKGGASESQGNSPPPGADPTDLRTEDAPARSDEDHRRASLARLSEQLDITSGLAEVCEHLAAIPKDDRVLAVIAAARLAQANARLGMAIAHLAGVERRQRTIVEQIPAPAPVLGHSNSNQQGAMMDALTAKMLRYMNKLAGEAFDPALEEAEADARANADSELAAMPAP